MELGGSQGGTLECARETELGRELWRLEGEREAPWRELGRRVFFAELL